MLNWQIKRNAPKVSLLLQIIIMKGTDISHY